MSPLYLSVALALFDAKQRKRFIDALEPEMSDGCADLLDYEAM